MTHKEVKGNQTADKVAIEVIGMPGETTSRLSYADYDMSVS